MTNDEQDFESKRQNLIRMTQRLAEKRRMKILDELVHRMENPEPTIPTGLRRLDELLDGGIRPGEVFVLAARPRVGKSAFALQLALKVAESGEQVTIWSLEMRPQQWLRRAVAALSQVNPKKLRRGGDIFSPEEINRSLTAMGQVRRLPIDFADTSNTTPEGFATEAEKQVVYCGASLLVIDYLQLMQPPKGAFSREQEVSQLSATIKRTANELAVPIVLLAQLNRNAEGRVPELKDLRESGAVEQDADEVFFLHREMNQDTHVLSNHGLGVLAKNRDGEAGSLRLTYDWRSYSFLEPA